jgi:hypothetical protein
MQYVQICVRANKGVHAQAQPMLAAAAAVLHAKRRTSIDGPRVFQQ